MGRYISSELYRARKSKGLIVLVAILALIIVAGVVLIGVTTETGVEKLQNTISSLVMFIASGHYGVLIILAIMLSGEMKEGSLKNSISSGMDRKAIVLGKTIAYTIISVLIFVFLILLMIGMGLIVSGTIPSADAGILESLKAILIMMVNALPLWLADLSIFLFIYIAVKNASTAGIVATLYGAGLLASILQLVVMKASETLRDILIFIISHIPSVMNLGQLQSATMSSGLNGEIFLTGIIYVVVFTTLSIIFMEKREF